MAVRAACDPKFSDYAIYEHCLPFNVADEAKGIDTPRIWTAERDMQMWNDLQNELHKLTRQNQTDSIAMARYSYEPFDYVTLPELTDGASSSAPVIIVMPAQSGWLRR